mgnify:CR=1 FL=1
MYMMIWLVMWSGLKELKRNTNTTHWNKNDWNHSRRKCYEIMENFKANWIWENCYKSCFYLSSSNLITSHSRDGSTPSDSATALVQPALKNAVYYGHSSLSFLFKIHYILTAFLSPLPCQHSSTISCFIHQKQWCENQYIVNPLYAIPIL